MLIVSALNMEFLTHTLGQTLAMRRARTGQDRGYVLYTMKSGKSVKSGKSRQESGSSIEINWQLSNLAMQLGNAI